MTTYEIRKRAERAQKMIERAFDSLTAIAEQGTPDEESGHYLNDAMQHATDAAMNASKLASHLNRKEWS